MKSSEKISFRVSKKEKDLIDQYSSKQGVTSSEFIKMKIFNQTSLFEYQALDLLQRALEASNSNLQKVDE